MGRLRHGGPRQPGCDTADTGPVTPATEFVDRSEAGGANGGATKAVDMDTFLFFLRNNVEAGNEEADRMANQVVTIGERMQLPDIATPVGIRQAYSLHPKAPPHLE